MDSKSDSKLRKLLLVEAMEKRLKRLLLEIEVEGLRIIREKDKVGAADDVIIKMKKEIDEILNIYKVLETRGRDIVGMDHRERQLQEGNEETYKEKFRVMIQQ